MKFIFVFAFVSIAAISAAPFANELNIEENTQTTKIGDIRAVIENLKQQAGQNGESKVKLLREMLKRKIDLHGKSETQNAETNEPEDLMKKVESKIAQLKLDGKLPESFKIPDNIQFPTKLEMLIKTNNELPRAVPKAFKVPENLQLPEKFRSEETFNLPGKMKSRLPRAMKYQTSDIHFPEEMMQKLKKM
jgi:hypothetical protein